MADATLQARWRTLNRAARETGREISPEWRSRRLFEQWLEEEELQIRTKVGSKPKLFFSTKFAVFDPKDVPLGPENCGLITEEIAHQLRAGGRKTHLPLGVATDQCLRTKPFQALVVWGRERYREWFPTASQAHAYWQDRKIRVLVTHSHRLKYDGWVPLFEKAIASIRDDLRLGRETKLN